MCFTIPFNCPSKMLWDLSILRLSMSPHTQPTKPVSPLPALNQAQSCEILIALNIFWCLLKSRQIKLSSTTFSNRYSFQERRKAKERWLLTSLSFFVFFTDSWQAKMFSNVSCLALLSRCLLANHLNNLTFK